MAEQTIQPEQVRAPELHRSEVEPKGVIRKNLKVLLFLGASAVVVIAAIISGYGKRAPAHSSAGQHDPPHISIRR